jgi:hypothetical protein
VRLVRIARVGRQHGELAATLDCAQGGLQSQQTRELLRHEPDSGAEKRLKAAHAQPRFAREGADTRGAAAAQELGHGSLDARIDLVAATAFQGHSPQRRRVPVDERACRPA